MSLVAIITDSSTCLPPDLLKKNLIHLVTNKVILDDKTYREGIDITSSEYIAQLVATNLIPSTQPPSVEDYKSVVASSIENGYSCLIITPSADVSPAFANALAVKNLFPPGSIETLDTRNLGIGQGFAVLAAAQAATSGARLSECSAIARLTSELSGTLIALESLDYLAAGNRANFTKKIDPSAYNIKLITTLKKGMIEPAESVYVMKKAPARMLQLAQKEIGKRPVSKVAILYAGSKDLVLELEEGVRGAFNPQELLVLEASPTVMSHGGPGLLGLVWAFAQ